MTPATVLHANRALVALRAGDATTASSAMGQARAAAFTWVPGWRTSFVRAADTRSAGILLRAEATLVQHGPAAALPVLLQLGRRG